MFAFNDLIFQPGQSITCRIEGNLIKGKIHFDEDMYCWICHDIRGLDGDRSPALYGYPYSWGFHIISNTRLSDGVTDLMPSEDILPSKNTKIDNKLKDILSSIIEYSLFMKAFYYKLSPFEDFSTIVESNDKGFIELIGSIKTKNGTFKKTINIKLSRFLKKISDSFASEMKKLDTETQPLFTDSQIEKIYNSFVASQSEDYYKLEVLRGNEIEEGYLLKNYSNVTNGTLHKSCMTNKVNYLGLYKNNDNIALAVLKSDKGVEARCLLWTLEDGTTYYDRIYYTFEWIQDVMTDKLKKGSFISLEYCSSKKLLGIKLKNLDFALYPYIDNFCNHSVRENTLYVNRDIELPKGQYKKYCRTDGSYLNFNI